MFRELQDLLLIIRVCVNYVAPAHYHTARSATGRAMGFAARLAVNEGGYFAQEQKTLLLNRLKALAEAGQLSKSVLQAVEAAALAPGSVNGIPTELRKRPAFENAFQHVHNKWKPGTPPPPTSMLRSISQTSSAIVSTETRNQ